MTSFKASLLAAALALALPPAARAQGLPGVQDEFFNDLSGKVSGPDRIQVSGALRRAGERSGTHCVIALLPRLRDYSALPQKEDAAADTLLREWRVGSVQEHRGLLLLFALDDRKVGYAQSSNLPSDLRERLRAAVRDRVLPLLKQGNVPAAMKAAASAIEQAVPARAASGGRRTTTRTTTERRPLGGGGSAPSSGGAGGSWVPGLPFGGECCTLLGLAGLVIVLVGLARGLFGGGGGGGYAGPGYGAPGWGGGGGPGWGGGGGGGSGWGGFMGGMLTGGALGYLLGDRHDHHGGSSGWGGGSHGGSSGWGGGGFTETTTTETWDSGGSSSSGFDTFGGSESGGGSSFGEW